MTPFGREADDHDSSPLRRHLAESSVLLLRRYHIQMANTTRHKTIGAAFGRTDQKAALTDY